MTRPLIVLGIDALDWHYVRTRLATLPHLEALNTLSPLNSVFPPDSIPAWTTIFTGRGPAEHGCLGSVDYLGSDPAAPAAGAAQFLRGQTFWDRASAAGKRVAVVNPFLAYPSWDVRGIMISGPVFVDGGVSITGIERGRLPPLPQLGGIVDFPTRRTFARFVHQTMAITRQQADFARALHDATRPDLLFLNILTLDRLKHFAWRYVDPADPTFPGPTPYISVVDDMYLLLDRIIGDFMTSGDVVVLSDHGHGRRCSRMLYVDELLRRAGLGWQNPGGLAALRHRGLEMAKRGALTAAYTLSVEDQAYRFARHLPHRHALKYSEFARPSDPCAARLSRTFGRNSFGGISLRVDNPYTRQSVISLLEAITDDGTTNVVRWARNREDVVSGRHLSRYPQILFELSGDYGVDFGIFGPLFGPDVNHRRISGGHRPTGVFGTTLARPAPRQLADVSTWLIEALDR